MALDRLPSGVFVGRLHEMGQLKAALEDAVAVRARLVMLAGEPGIGKTRIAHELAAYAEQRGVHVLWGRCYEERGVPPYWPWAQIIRSYVRQQEPEMLRSQMGAGAGDIAGIVPDVLERLPDLQPPPSLEDPEQARFRLFDSITFFLKSASQQQPLLLVLDNLHWADKPSLLLLEFIARELEEARLLMLGTYRDVELSRQHPLSETLGELTRERLFQRISLHGLSPEDVGQFIEVVAAIKPPQDLVKAVHTQTEGSPLFMTEVVRLLTQEGELTPERLRSRLSLRIRIPEGVREVIGRRLNRLSETCNQILSVASVIGREFGLDELEHLIPDLSGDRILDALDEAVMARVIEELSQVVGRYQFSHTLIQKTLYDELTTVRRVRLHRRIGEVLEGLYKTNPEPHLARLAHHFFEAAQAGSMDKAIEYAEKAGLRAMSLLAYEEAVRYYEMAFHVMELKEPADAAHSCKLLLALGEAQRKAGEVLNALETFQRAAGSARGLRSPEALAQAALGFGETLVLPGLPGEPAVRLFEEALSTLGEDDSTLRARALGGLAKALAFTGSHERAAMVAQQAIEMARRVGNLLALATTLSDSLLSIWGRPEKIVDRIIYATESMRLAEAAGDWETLINAHGWRFMSLIELGDVPAADAEIEALARLAEEVRSPHYTYVTVSWRAMRALLDGRFEEAEGLARQALAFGQRLQAHGVAGVFGVQMFTLRREQGHLKELEPLVRSFVQQHPDASTWRPGLALIYSELGLEAEARAEFEHLAANNFTDIPQDALWLTCIAYLAEVCAFLGDADRAAILYQLLLPYAGRTVSVSSAVACYGAASRYLGLLAATMARWAEAEQHFEDALEMNARMGARPWLAHTQHQYAEMLLARRQAGDREKALSLLGEALTIAHELGMSSLEEQVVALQDRARPQPAKAPEYPYGLTQREVEVLRLIAAGKSNREIAEELFISSYTVANHVVHIFNKTGAANRAEAVILAARHNLV